MRRRTFTTSDTHILTFQLLETDGSTLSTTILRWSSAGAGVEVPPGGLKYLGSFQDVFNFLVSHPNATRDEIEAILPRFGYVSGQ